MIFFAVGTFHFYRDDVRSIEAGETVGAFADKNEMLIQRVRQEAINYYDYELSGQQMGKAIEAYLIPARSLLDTRPASPTKD